MSKDTILTDAGQQYKAAYGVHYSTKNLQEAIALYKGIIAAHPEAPEAEYSRAQLQNIVKEVVPKQELMDSEIKLTLHYLNHSELPNFELVPASKLTAKQPN